MSGDGEWATKSESILLTKEEDGMLELKSLVNVAVLVILAIGAGGGGEDRPSWHMRGRHDAVDHNSSGARDMITVISRYCGIKFFPIFPMQLKMHTRFPLIF